MQWYQRVTAGSIKLLACNRHCSASFPMVYARIPPSLDGYLPSLRIRRRRYPGRDACPQCQCLGADPQDTLGMCQDSPNTPNAIVSRAPNPGPLGLRFSSDLSPESSQKGEKPGACPPDLGRRSGGWRQLGCRSAALAAGLLSQGFDVRPEITPGCPFSFGEPRQGQVVADAGQVGVLLPVPELPDDRPAGLGRAGFELPRPVGPLGLQPVQGLLPQCSAGGLVGRRVVLALPAAGQGGGAGDACSDVVADELRVGPGSRVRAAA